MRSRRFAVDAAPAVWQGALRHDLRWPSVSVPEALCLSRVPLDWVGCLGGGGDPGPATVWERASVAKHPRWPGTRGVQAR